MQRIDLDAVVKNAQYLKKLIGEKKLCAVVKSNAYGHGINRVASVLQDIADCFAVGTLAEALQVQKYCKDVLILLPLDGLQLVKAIENNFLLTLDSFETLNSIVSSGLAARARVHIKIDSGMSRLGFALKQIPQLIELLGDKSIRVEGVFSHFYDESEKNCDEQLNYFEKCSTIICERLGEVTRHIANTCGALTNARYHLDMVRIGLGLYGYGSKNLTPAKTVTAKVIATKSLQKNSVIGYGATYTCQSNCDIAILDIGYANGLPRNLYGAKILLNGCLCPIVGRTCMSMCMVDTTGVFVRVGDCATILGRGVDISNDECSVYQLLCNLD